MAGVFLVVLGLLVMLGSRFFFFGFGRLPGDIRIERDRAHLHPDRARADPLHAHDLTRPVGAHELDGADESVRLLDGPHFPRRLNAMKGRSAPRAL